MSMVKILIALTPSACFRMDKEGIRYSLMTDFVYPETLGAVNSPIKAFSQLLWENNQWSYYKVEFLVLMKQLGQEVVWVTE